MKKELTFTAVTEPLVLNFAHLGKPVYNAILAKEEKKALIVFPKKSKTALNIFEAIEKCKAANFDKKANPKIIGPKDRSTIKEGSSMLNLVGPDDLYMNVSHAPDKPVRCIDLDKKELDASDEEVIYSGVIAAVYLDVFPYRTNSANKSLPLTGITMRINTIVKVKDGARLDKREVVDDSDLEAMREAKVSEMTIDDVDSLS